jgi:HIV Tat-specific factor 1
MLLVYHVVHLFPVNRSRMMIHYLEEAKVDGFTLAFDAKQNQWLRIADIPILRTIMHQISAEEEVKANVLANASEVEQVFDGFEDQPKLPDELKAKPRKKYFVADDGKRYVWDDEEDDWVEHEGSVSSDDEDGGGDSSGDEAGDGARGGGAAQGKAGAKSETKEEEAGEKEKRIRKKKNKKKRGATDGNSASNTWIYVNGLPKDVSIDEIRDHFSKVGLIALNPFDQQPRIKLYREADNTLKGDCSICYNSATSVQMALDLLDGGYIRPNAKISVCRAEFQKRETGGVDGDDTVAKKRARVPASQAQKRVAKNAISQALAWNEDDDVGVSKHKALKIVVLEGMFTLEEISDDAFLEELEADIATECEKFGGIEKMTVFSKNPRGIIIVKFATAFAAQECVRVMNGRYFGGRKIRSFFWDGATNYSVSASAAEAEAAAEEEEKERLDEFGDWLDSQQEELPEEFALHVEK